MVRKSAIAAVLLALAFSLTAAAQNKAVVFTKSGMEEAALPWRFIDSPLHNGDARRVHWHLGWVEIKTPIGPIRVLLLPIMAPLSGSPGSRDWNEMPNPFKLTGMQIPQRPGKESYTDVVIVPPKAKDDDKRATPP